MSKNSFLVLMNVLNILTQKKQFYFHLWIWKYIWKCMFFFGPACTFHVYTFAMQGTSVLCTLVFLCTSSIFVYLIQLFICCFVFNNWQSVYFLCFQTPPRRRIVRRCDGEIWHTDAWRLCLGLLFFMSIGVIVTKKVTFFHKCVHIGRDVLLWWVTAGNGSVPYGLLKQAVGRGRSQACV